MKGILLKIAPGQLATIRNNKAIKALSEDVVKKIKELKQKSPQEEIAVIGVHPTDGDSVLLTAKVDTMLATGKGISLRYVRIFDSKDRWTLPRGYAQSHTFRGEPKECYEVLVSEVDVLACLIKSPSALLAPNGPQMPFGFHWNIGAASNIIVSFNAMGRPQMHSRNAFNCEVLGDFENYTDVLNQVWSQMKGITFQEAVGELFQEIGFLVEQSKPTKDGGVDLTLLRRDPLIGTDKYVVQCKRYSLDHKIASNVVTQLKGSADNENAQRGIIVTTSTFTPDAIEATQKDSISIQLIDGKELAAVVLPRVGSLPILKKLLEK